MTKHIATMIRLGMVTLWLSVAGCYYYDDDDDCDLKIQTDALPAGVVNVEYRFNLDSKCGGDDWFIADGNLPPGISLQSDGDLLGVPIVAGIFNFTVGVVEYDFDGTDEAFKGFQLIITGAAVATPTPTPVP